MNVLVTGGAGYIGSHAALHLLEAGHNVTIVDDLTRGHREVVDILAPLGDLHWVEADTGDATTMAAVLAERGIEIVMHFAALAYVGESVEQPLRYYRKNAAGTLGLLEAMAMRKTPRLVFSSTCASYGEPDASRIPIDETCPQQPVNPYGRTKLIGEQMIADHAAAAALRGEDFGYARPRYFNVAGCDRQGRLGEDHEPETHLVPICLDAALGRRDGLSIFGTDYPTPDGTCVRDYVHVDDLIGAHMVVMDALRPGDAHAYNIGIGRGHSVREVIDACRRVSGVDFPVTEGPRRAGDPPELWCNPAKIRSELGWSAQITDLDETIRSAWTWRQANPGGYAGS